MIATTIIVKGRRRMIERLTQEKSLVEPPRPMKENPKQQKSNKYCHFHRDKGHDTKTVSS